MSIARLVATVLLLTVGVASPAAAARGLPGEDTAAALAAAPPPRVLATATFRGGQRLVTGIVRASMPTSLPGTKIELVASLACGTEGIGNTQNVARGTSVTLTPRLLVPDARECRLWASSVGFGESTGRELVVSGELRAGPVVAGARGYEPTGQPVRITPGQSVEIVPASLAMPRRTLALRVVADVKTTTCTAVGGSRENGSPYLCAGHVDPTGSRIRISVRVGGPGTACPGTTVAEREVFVDGVRHHVMTFQHGTYLLPQLRSCGRTVRVVTVVQALSGSDLVVHARGTASAVTALALPRA
jgi:hypothetical protein